MPTETEPADTRNPRHAPSVLLGEGHDVRKLHLVAVADDDSGDVQEGPLCGGCLGSFPLWRAW